MKKFEIGQQVVAIKSAPPDTEQAIYPGYQKGKIYEVSALMYCPHCGVQYIEVGVCYIIPNGKINSGLYFCDACNQRQDPKKGCWAISTDFAPIDEIDNLLNSAIEEEYYEMAAGLRDVKKLIK